jgi:hypothetical protein
MANRLFELGGMRRRQGHGHGNDEDWPHPSA